MKANRYQWLKLQQLDRKLAETGACVRSAPVPEDGWIKTLRTTIGMSAARLAERLGVQQSTVTRLEQSERERTITLESLRKAADVLDCDLHYVLVPRRSLEALVRARADELAREEVARVHRTMQLEDQAADDRVREDQLEERRADLLRGSWRNLWK